MITKTQHIYAHNSLKKPETFSVYWQDMNLGVHVQHNNYYRERRTSVIKHT